MLPTAARTRWALGAASALTLAASGVRAQSPGPRVVLRWSAPAECSSASEVVAEVDRILGPSGARPARPVEVDAKVTGASGAYTVRVETASADGPRVRTLQGHTCAALADATALLIALVIDPSAVPPAPRAVVVPASPEPAPSGSPDAGGPSTPPAPTPAPPNAPAATAAAVASAAPTASATPVASAARTTRAPRASARTARAPAPARASGAPPSSEDAAARSSSRAADSRAAREGMVLAGAFRLAAWAGGDAGSLPTVAPGFGADAAVVLRHVRVAAGFAAYPARERVVDSVRGFGGRVGLVTGWGGGCGVVAPRAFELGACADLEVGSLAASGFRVSDPSEGASLWVAPRLGGLFAWFPWDSAGLRLRFGAAVPLSRPTFVLRNVGAVDRPGAVVGRMDGGFEARF